MAKLSECIGHKFVDNTFDLPKSEINVNGDFKPQYLKYQPSEEFCKYCGIVRIPVYKDGEFIQWQIQPPEIL
jgi:hypothetical protein